VDAPYLVHDRHSEVQHGLNCLRAAWNSDHGIQLRATLDAMFPGITQDVQNRFNAGWNSLQFESFVTSLSEHAGPGLENEDAYGRLSMWRGFARGVGVALVVKHETFWHANAGLGLYTSPVAYLDDAAFARQFGEVVENIEANKEQLKVAGQEAVTRAILLTFSAAAISTKHPGFLEEREWRIIRSPDYPVPCPLPRVIQTVGGVPQPVILLKLESDTSLGTSGIDPPELLDRIIIGPTSYPMAIYSAYLQQMTDSKIKNPTAKLILSNLPLRDG
jgi:DUF2971 family protein